MPDPPQSPPEPAAIEDLRSLMERARQGNQSVLPQLRAALDARPDLWQRFGDLAAHAEASWIRLAAGPDLGMAEALKRKVAALKAELAGPAPTPLERLLIERVAATHLQVSYADASIARAAPETPLMQMDFALRRQAQAHRSHLQALGALATVRRLLPGGIEVRQAYGDEVVSAPVTELDVGEANSPGGNGTPAPPAAAAAAPDATASAPVNLPLALFDPRREGAKAEDRLDAPRRRRGESSR